MTAYEMLLSESQERMLIVAHKGREREAADIFRNGTSTPSYWPGARRQPHARRHNGEVFATPVKALTDEAPIYQRPMKEFRVLVSSFRFGRRNKLETRGKTRN